MEQNRDHSSIVEFREAGFSLENGQALVSGLNLTIHQGETLILLGRSGSGKTTTLKLINRLLEPTEGEVLIEGRATTEWDPIQLRRHVGYAIQDVGLFPHFSVGRNIGLVPSIEHWPAERVRSRVHELMVLVGLDPQLASRYPRELSGGQRQRVGVARALAADPPVLLMDEPFGALDPITRTKIQREFQTLKQRLNKTIVFVTHDLREALLLATRIGFFEAGRLLGVYTPAEFMRTTDRVASQYLASFRTGNNWLEYK